jgi:putative flippase GtrA
MDKKIFALVEKFKSVWRWMLVGLLIRITDYLVFIFSYSVVSSVYIANFFSGVISVPLSYISHRYYTFSSEENISKSGLRYLFRLIILWIFGTFLLRLLLQLGINPNIIKIVAIPIMAPISYFSLKLFVFKK